MNKRAILSAGLICMMLISGCASDNEVKSETTVAVSVASTSETSDTTPEETTTVVAASETDAPEETTWSPSSLMDGLITTISYDNRYNAVINNAEDATRIIRLFGEKQKATYTNPDVSLIEQKIEDEFDIIYVALGEIDVDTAQDIYTACEYMFTTYPELKGTLTDLTLGNFTWNATAQTRTFEFVTNDYNVPIVLKSEIILGASSFLKRDALLKSCQEQEASGFWPKNASISMIVVHELAHHLLDVHMASHHGFSGYYVTSDNYIAYRDFSQEALSWYQALAKQVIQTAYTKWLLTNEGSEDDFRGSISGYALGLQSDGGISYSETFAEAIADIYANGENAAYASKLILEALSIID